MITTTFNKRLKKYCSEAGIPYRSSHNTSLSQGHDTRRGLFGYICQFRNERCIATIKIQKICSAYQMQNKNKCNILSDKLPYQKRKTSKNQGVKPLSRDALHRFALPYKNKKCHKQHNYAIYSTSLKTEKTSPSFHYGEGGI